MDTIHLSGTINPIKSAREQLHLSINDLSNLTGVHRQVIIRTEQGCYESIPPRISRFLEQRLGLDFSDSSSSLAVHYHSWVAEKRVRSYGALYSPLPAFDPERHPFILWRETSGLKRIEVCKLFCVHPSTLTRFETNLSMQSVPLQLHEALLESGYNSHILDELSVHYNLYRRLCLARYRDNRADIEFVEGLIKLHVQEELKATA